MKAQAIFHWKKSRSEHSQGEGITRDVSVMGAYVVSSTCPPVNTKIRMEIIFPRPGSPITPSIKSVVTVIRVEHDIVGDIQSGFSVAGKNFSLDAGKKVLSR
jgi:hypothetical protein